MEFYSGVEFSIKPGTIITLKGLIIIINASTPFIVVSNRQQLLHNDHVDVDDDDGDDDDDYHRLDVVVSIKICSLCLFTYIPI